jgi:hypothetical protein
MTTYEHLKPYKRPDSYFGPDYWEHYPVLGQSRDSVALERSNFVCGLERLGGESDTVLVVRDSHWAVGWVETVYVHKSDLATLAEADKMLDDLASYPVVDEDHFNQLEREQGEKRWEQTPVADRVRVIQEWSEGECNIFAARRDSPPCDIGVEQYLRDA